MPICHERIRTEIPRGFPKGYPSSPKTWGERLRRRRMDLGLTQHQLAQRLGCLDESVRKWEADFECPLSRRWPLIAAVLGCDLLPIADNAAGMVRDARTRAGLTQAELATAAGVHVRSVRNCENPRYQPRPATINRILMALQMTFERSGSPNSPEQLSGDGVFAESSRATHDYGNGGPDRQQPNSDAAAKERPSVDSARRGKA